MLPLALRPPGRIWVGDVWQQHDEAAQLLFSLRGRGGGLVVDVGPDVRGRLRIRPAQGESGLRRCASPYCSGTGIYVISMIIVMTAPASADGSIGMTTRSAAIRQERVTAVGTLQILPRCN